jgi:exopolysaccharide production protein ExoQ
MGAMSLAHRDRPTIARGQAAIALGQPTIALALGLTWAVAFSFVGWLAMLSVLPYQGYGLAAMLVAFIVVPAIGLWCVAQAGARGGGFLLVIVLAVVLVSDLSVRGAARGIDAQSAVKFALWVSGLLLLPWRWQVVKSAAGDVPTLALLLFGGWALVSTAYSITPLYTFAAALGYLGMAVIAVVFATTFDAGRGLLWVTSALLALSGASLVLYAVAPDVAMVAYENAAVLRLGGIFGNANQVGEIAALALLLGFVAWFDLRARRGWLLLLVAAPVCAACLLLSQSRSSMLGLAAGVAVVVLRRFPLLLLPAIGTTAALGAIVHVYPNAVDVLIGLVARSGNVAQVTTLTGRTEIWQFVLSAIAKAPVLGYGFASTKELIPAGHAFAYGWTTTSAHNLWLQAWVTTGAVGLLLIVISQLAALKALVGKPLAVRDGVLAFVLFTGPLEAGPVGPTVSTLTFVWLWATAMSLRQTQAAVA